MLKAVDIAERLDPKYRLSGDRYLCKCPAHSEKTGSMIIRDGEKRLVFYCYAGCSSREIFNAIIRTNLFKAEDLGVSGTSQSPGSAPGKKMESKDRPASRQSDYVYVGQKFGIPEFGGEKRRYLEQRTGKLMHPSHIWAWHQPDGSVFAHTIRYDDGDTKYVMPFSIWTENGKTKPFWRMAAPVENELWYDMHLDQGQEDIILVEGEKCAEAAKKFQKENPGILTRKDAWITTGFGGSKKIQRANMDRFRGRKITVLPDMDEPGLHYAAATLRSDATSIVIQRLSMIDPEWEATPYGFDIADLVSEGYTAEHLTKAGQRVINRFLIR